ncbi:hypothetical protein SASPL_136238 [Salvia splendens]|uniref:non-specific serine/threonine protein kinase n=1 Tax=Salvia splendens TaxID=180675 RepID=A0A8X8X0Z7_SALSN|nr:hypothetical protein SASPL_136238 [Salvia splendens]
MHGNLFVSSFRKFVFRDLIQILMHKPFQLTGIHHPGSQERSNGLLEYRWKKVGHYNMKCLFTRSIHNLDSNATSNHMNDNHYANGITSISTNGSQPSSAVKFEIQLYKTSEVEYVLDLQRLSGPVFIFLDLCAYFMMQLEFISMLTSDKKFVTSM